MITRHPESPAQAPVECSDCHDVRNDVCDRCGHCPRCSAGRGAAHMKTTARLTVPKARSVRKTVVTPTGERVTILSVPDGTLSGDITVQIDVEEIVRTIGAQALRNKSRRAVGLGGLIVALASNLKREGAFVAGETAPAVPDSSVS